MKQKSKAYEKMMELRARKKGIPYEPEKPKFMTFKQPTSKKPEVDNSEVDDSALDENVTVTDLKSPNDLKSNNTESKIITPQKVAITQSSVIHNDPNAESKAMTEVNTLLDKKDVTYDMLRDDQKPVVDMGKAGKSFAVIGSGGSGKTTTLAVLLRELFDEMDFPTINGNSRYLRRGMPSVVVTSFMKVAVNNFKEALPRSQHDICINTHKLIEFAPVVVLKKEIDEHGNEIEKPVKQFMPTYNNSVNLPEVKVCIIEEAGSFDCELFWQLVSALPRGTQFIFLGDIKQIPPVYGLSVLAFAMKFLPTYELTGNGRQSNGPILDLANKVCEGRPINVEELQELMNASTPKAKLTLVPLTKDDSPVILTKKLQKRMQMAVESGEFVKGHSIFITNVRQDNHKYLNIADMNRAIAHAFSQMEGRETHHIISRSSIIQNYYLAVGDLMFYERAYYIIEDIIPNPEYIKQFGEDYCIPSKTLSRVGLESDPAKVKDQHALEAEMLEVDMNAVLDVTTSKILEEEEEKKRGILSHKLKLVPFEADENDPVSAMEVSTCSEMGKLFLGYAQTAHSAQGSEWRNVFLGFPKNSQFMLTREILYTSITRARTELTIFFEDGSKRKKSTWLKGTFQDGIKRQSIKGNTLAEKIEFLSEKCEAEQYKYMLVLIKSIRDHGHITEEAFKKAYELHGPELKRADD